jgi:hypothetical protein
MGNCHGGDRVSAIAFVCSKQASDEIQLIMKSGEERHQWRLFVFEKETGNHLASKTTSHIYHSSTLSLAQYCAQVRATSFKRLEHKACDGGSQKGAA